MSRRVIAMFVVVLAAETATVCTCIALNDKVPYRGCSIISLLVGQTIDERQLVFDVLDIVAARAAPRLDRRIIKYDTVTPSAGLMFSNWITLTFHLC